MHPPGSLPVISHSPSERGWFGCRVLARQYWPPCSPDPLPARHHVDIAASRGPCGPSTTRTGTAALAANPRLLHICALKRSVIWFWVCVWGFLPSFRKLPLWFSVIKCKFAEKIRCVTLPRSVSVSNYHDLSVL